MRCDVDIFWLGSSSYISFSILTSMYVHLSVICTYISYLQLGRASLNPPRHVLKVEGTSTLQAAMPGKLKSKHFFIQTSLLIARCAVCCYCSTTSLDGTLPTYCLAE